MNFRLIAVLLFLGVALVGCKASMHFFDYTQRVGVSSQGQATNALVEVQIKVLTGLRKTEPQMSVAKTYEFDATIQSGQIPGSPSATKVRVRLFHDWTDVLVKDNAVLTLRLTTNGLLFDIKEFVVTGIPNSNP